MRHGRAIRLAAVATVVCGAVGYASSANASVNAISGIVRGAQGQTVAGARVQLNALAVDKTGVHEISIASTTSDASGRYAFPAPTASQTAVLAKVDLGEINYEVDASYVSGGVLQAATATAPASAAVSSASAQARTAAGLPAAGGMDLTAHPVQLAGGKLAKASAVSPNVGGCYFGWNSVSGGTYSVIMGEPHAFIDMSVQYQYTQSAVTTIGLAYSANGGPWAANGTFGVSYVGDSGLITAPSGIHYAPYVYGQWTYVKQQEYGYGSQGCAGTLNSYRIVPTGWTGGSTISGNLTAYDGPNSPGWLYDQAHGGNGEIKIPLNATFYKDGGSGATYGGGVSFAGISLSSNTTYSSSVKYTWKMGGNTNVGHDLFGANGVFPAQSSGATIVYAN